MGVCFTREGQFMQHVKILKLAVAAFILGLGALASARVSAEEVIAVADGNKWDGQWHFDATLYGWVPFMYTTVNIPAIAGAIEVTLCMSTPGSVTASALS